MADGHYHSIRFDAGACHGCMACMRVCPTQAIRVRQGVAAMIEDRCIDCGECIKACPKSAVVPLTASPAGLGRFDCTIAVPSPALYTQFDGEVTPGVILQALKASGFDAVATLSWAGEAVTRALELFLSGYRGPVPLISSFCPSVVRLVQIKYPELVDQLLPILSPREVAAREAKRAAADETGTTGSVEYRIDARLTAGEGVILSDVFVFDPARPARQEWKTVVDGRVDGAAIEVGVEMYPVKGKGSVTSVAFDVADSPGGPAIVGARARPVSGDSGRRQLAATDVDIRLLPPGDYVVVATAYSKDRVLGRVSRPFRRDPMPLDAGGVPRAAFGVAESGGLIRAFDRLDVLRAGALDFFLTRLAESDPGPASEAVASAASALRAGQYDAAVSALSGAAPDRLSVPFLKGLALLGKGELEPAAAEFRSALRVSSEFLPAAFYLGACYAAGGRDREAAGAWQMSLVSESAARIVFDVLADAWLRGGDGERAESIAREAMGLWPEDDRFVPRLSAAQTMQKRAADALATLAPYLEAHPDDASALFLAMRMLFDARTAGTQVLGAVEDAERAAKYAAAYRAAGGKQAALVDRWALFVQQSRKR